MRLKFKRGQAAMHDNQNQQGSMEKHFFLDGKYTPRKYADNLREYSLDPKGASYVPDVYPFAAFLGWRFGCTHIIDIGQGNLRRLADLSEKFHVVNIGSIENMQYHAQQCSFGEWIEWDFEKPDRFLLPEKTLMHSVIICSDMIEHLANPSHLLETLKSWLDHAPVCMLTTPERDLVNGKGHIGPPTNPAHVREWNISELEKLLLSIGFNVTFIGLTATSDLDYEKKTILAILEKNESSTKHMDGIAKEVPSNFRVVALMASYNEEDIIVPSISHLIKQGIEVYLIDSSTDSTFDLAKQFLGRGLIGIEKYPKEGQSSIFDLYDLLKRKEEIAREIKADWFIQHDVDEIHVSPKPNVNLREALYAVDRAGFNCVDYIEITFHPTDNEFVPGSDFESYFKYFGFNTARRMITWKNFGQSISLARSGGHEIKFKGRKVYPYKFLLKHYLYRSQEHGEKKVFRERKSRYNPTEKAMGWHTHYDEMKEGHVFVRNPSELTFFEESYFNKTYLIERLSGIGVIRYHSPQKRDWRHYPKIFQYLYMSALYRVLRSKVYRFMNRLKLG